MVLKYCARCIVLILLLCLAINAGAQPMLPGITGAVDKGIVVLSWNSQFNSLKSITVLRSADSIANFSTIGTVRNLDKGLQAFVDGHPAPGNNYYRLVILFRSGLSWRSNLFSVYIDSTLHAQPKKTLPRNDSLQHFTVTEEKSNAAPVGAKQTANPDKTTGKQQDAPVQDITKLKIAVNFDNKESTPADLPAVKPEEPKHKIVLSFEDPEANLSLLVKSKLIYTDPVTGHVNMMLPDDVNKHNYSVKFFDQKNHMLFEVPRVKASRIIIEKRNFQGKGVYKFVLRKDILELERGYVEVGP